MSDPNAAASGTFKIGGELAVHRLGFGAMRITGKSIWGYPEDRDATLAMLRRLPALGVNFIDTAEAYGPETSELLINEALHPYLAGMVVATKSGLARPSPKEAAPLGRPEFLRQGAELNRRRLGVERIDLWQLHRIDPKVPRDEQFDAVRTILDDGLARFVGLSAVTVEEIEAAQKVFPVATVQNAYNVVDRSHEAVLDYCEANDIGFIPYVPLAKGDLAGPGSAVQAVADKHKATPGQIALAWLLQRSPVMLPIPGTGRLAHLVENVAAAAIALDGEDVAALNAVGQSGA